MIWYVFSSFSDGAESPVTYSVGGGKVCVRRIPTWKKNLSHCKYLYTYLQLFVTCIRSVFAFFLFGLGIKSNIKVSCGNVYAAPLPTTVSFINKNKWKRLFSICLYFSRPVHIFYLVTTPPDSILRRTITSALYRDRLRVILSDYYRIINTRNKNCVLVIGTLFFSTLSIETHRAPL